MNAIRLISVAALCTAGLGCGGGATESAAPGAAGASGTGGGAGSGGAAGAGAGGAAGSGGSAGAGAGGGTAGKDVTLEMQSFTVPAGGEIYKCQNFANPFGGDADVTAFESHMTPGSHHLLLFYRSAAVDGPLEDCSGLEFTATPYGTQLAEDHIAYPAGVASRIGSGYGYRLQAHYLNTTATDIQAEVKVVLHSADPTTITAHAGVYFFTKNDFYVPAGTTQDVKQSCKIPYDANIIQTTSHMHRHATHFESTINGVPLFSTDRWDEVTPAFFDPARAVKAGDKLDFTCTFQNDGTLPLTVGESAKTNEMCITSAQFYPIADLLQPLISCQ